MSKQRETPDESDREDTRRRQQDQQDASLETGRQQDDNQDDLGRDINAPPDRHETETDKPREARPGTSEIVYEVVEHDGGWAYRVGDVYSERYASHDDAREAAEAAARRQQLEGEPEVIEYEDADGKWHVELEPGDERPATGVADRTAHRGGAKA